MPFGEIVVFGLLADVDPRVVDQDVEPSEPLQAAVHQGLAVGLDGNVGRDRYRLGTQPLEPAHRDGALLQGCARRRPRPAPACAKPMRHRQPDAAIAARDDGHPPRKIEQSAWRRPPGEPDGPDTIEGRCLAASSLTPRRAAQRRPVEPDRPLRRDHHECRCAHDLTERFGLEHPILSAPMAFVAGGALAAAVSRAGGLGLIGGGYGDGDWLDAQFAAAGNQQVGCGFITWSLAGNRHLLTRALERQPRALMLSFGDPLPFAEEVRAAGSALICQVQTLAHARRAIEAGADVLVAQGAEAGGHGAVRGTLTLVPEVRDLCARGGTDALVLAAGGIADGRGLAAALMLGADGVLVGTCLYAAEESLVHPALRRAVVAADGDATVRTSVVDIIRGTRLATRVLYPCAAQPVRGAVARTRGLPEGGAGGCHPRLRCCRFRAGDADESAVIVGEAVGLIGAVRPAAEIIQEMVAGAEELLRGSERLTGQELRVRPSPCRRRTPCGPGARAATRGRTRLVPITTSDRAVVSVPRA